MAKKLRADQLLVEQGLVESRELAKRLIMAGEVYYVRTAKSGQELQEPVDKPGRQFAAETELFLKQAQRFVSRGGFKLLTAMDTFSLDVAGKVALDAGASTGGFTDCLLQHGAVKVYAVDVGTAQLHEKLRADKRVISLEKTNLRLAGATLIPEPVDVLVADVSFISLTQILEPCDTYLRPGAEAVVLVKPQFELGPGQTDKGVVRDAGLQQQAVDKVISFAEQTLGWTNLGCVPSQIKGPKGNQEYLLYLRKNG